MTANSVSPSVSPRTRRSRSEEHTSELQSRLHLVCRLLLEKKKNNRPRPTTQSDRSDSVKCSCCDETRDPTELTALRCHPDVQVCQDFIGWLSEPSGAVDPT